MCGIEVLNRYIYLSDSLHKVLVYHILSLRPVKKNCLYFVSLGFSKFNKRVVCKSQAFKLQAEQSPDGEEASLCANVSQVSAVEPAKNIVLMTLVKKILITFKAFTVGEL